MAAFLGLEISEDFVHEVFLTLVVRNDWAWFLDGDGLDLWLLEG